MVSSENKLISGKENDASDMQSSKATKKKGPSKTGRLSRPVICICNDLFAPALRSLRQVARVHTFVQPSTSRVVNRLKYICNKEGFKTSAQGLTALAEFTECDIRACLNTLQFLNRKNEILNVVDVGSQVVGRKDMTSSIFDIWREVFQKRKPKMKGPALDSHKQGTEDFARLHDLISHHGDYELGVEGIYENFLHVRYHDSAMEKTVKCLDFLCDSDLLIQRTMRNQHFFLYVYQPSINIAIRRLVAQVEKPSIEWPKSFQRYRAVLIEKKDLLKSWVNSISPATSRYLSIKSIVEDVVSSLLCILSPPGLRPVASQLLSEKEREEINQLVNTMIDYAVTYKKAKVLPSYGSHRQDANLDAQALCFDPPINDFVKFKDYTSGHRLLSSAMQQILTHEVERQTILRESTARTARASRAAIMEHGTSITEDFEAHAGQANLLLSLGESSPKFSIPEVETNKSGGPITNPSKSIASIKAAVINNATESIVNSKSKLVDAMKKPSGSFNFFDRFKRSSQKGTENNEKSAGCLLTSQRDSRPLLFKFNEGFTNAVKRPVRLREFL
eukprot:Gb_40705 [translate_table: standard]